MITETMDENGGKASVKRCIYLTTLSTRCLQHNFQKPDLLCIDIGRYHIFIAIFALSVAKYASIAERVPAASSDITTRELPGTIIISKSKHVDPI